MKKIISFLFALVALIGMTSCTTTAQAQVDEVYVSTDNSGVDFNVVITYGTPYYNTEGLLLYYIYRDLYYYPYWYHNRWYFKHYSRPITHYRPIRRDFYKHRPTHSVNRNHHTTTPYNHRSVRSNTHYNHTPNINRSRVRPTNPPRTSTRNGHFGGRR